MRFKGEKIDAVQGGKKGIIPVCAGGGIRGGCGWDRRLVATREEEVGAALCVAVCLCDVQSVRKRRASPDLFCVCLFCV